LIEPYITECYDPDEYFKDVLDTGEDVELNPPNHPIWDKITSPFKRVIQYIGDKAPRLHSRPRSKVVKALSQLREEEQVAQSSLASILDTVMASQDLLLKDDNVKHYSYITVPANGPDDVDRNYEVVEIPVSNVPHTTPPPPGASGERPARIILDLLYHLQLYAGFKERDYALLLSLKARGIRWMEEHSIPDCWSRVTLLTTVAASMLLSRNEQLAYQILDDHNLDVARKTVTVLKQGKPFISEALDNPYYLHPLYRYTFGLFDDRSWRDFSHLQSQ
jgi:hypothetical protein